MLIYSYSSVGGLSLYVTYGQRVKRQHDPLVCSAEEGFGNLARAVAPGNHLVNVLPLLKYLLSWMPGSSFKQEAEELRRHLNELRDGPYGAAMQMIVRRSSLFLHFLPQYTIGRGNSPTIACFICFRWKWDGTGR